MQPTLTIGELAQLTGITTHTLRIWEKRYQALNVVRLPSGHRRYPESEVKRLRAVNRAIEKGHKPKKVTACGVGELNQLVENEEQFSEQDSNLIYNYIFAKSSPVTEWLSAIDYFDETGFASLLQSEWEKSGPLRFISDCVGPFLQQVGMRWENHELSIAQEHFGSDVLSNFLSTQWRKLNQNNKGRPVVLTTLPGEPHGLGVLMCAVATAYAGRRVISLGVNTPLEEMIDSVKRGQAVALGVSVSNHFNKNVSRELIADLDRDLPLGAGLLVGGEGQPEARGRVVNFNSWESYFLHIKNNI